MKTCSKLTQWIVGLTACCCAFGFQSCKEDNYSYYVLPYPNALVTVKPQQDNSFYLQLDDSTTLLPTNLATSPFGEKEVRALVNYVETDEAHGNYSKAVHINWIDSILTKPIAPLLGSDNDAVYGTDPVEIVNDWVTLAEDGYLTLRFRTLRSDMGKAHFVNLLHVPEADNPYVVEFRHNAYGDVYGREADALVAFNLDRLPDTEVRCRSRHTWGCPPCSPCRSPAAGSRSSMRCASSHSRRRCGAGPQSCRAWCLLG